MYTSLWLVLFHPAFLSSHPYWQTTDQLGLFVTSPAKILFSRRTISFTHATFITQASLGDTDTCLTSITSERWYSASEPALLPKLTQLKATIKVTKSMLGSIAQFLQDLGKLPSEMSDSLPEPSCTTTISLFRTLPVSWLGVHCNHLAEKLHDTSSNNNLFGEFIKTANSDFDSYLLDIGQVYNQLDQIFMRITMLQAKSFPESYRFALDNCTDSDTHQLTVVGCNAHEHNFTCALQVDTYHEPIPYKELTPVHYRHFHASLPFPHTGLHPASLTMFDMSTCTSISTKDTYCSSLKYTHQPCYTASLTTHMDQILQACIFHPTRNLTRSVPQQCDNQLILFDYSTAMGILTINGSTIKERPVAVGGVNFTYQVLNSLIRYHLPGKHMVMGSKFTIIVDCIKSS